MVIKQLYEIARNERLAEGALKEDDYMPEIKEIALIENRLEEMSKVILYFNEDLTVSMFKTMEELKKTNEELFYYIAFTAVYPRRANLTEKANRCCALVPVFMSAHKEFNNVRYEHWNKTDKAIQFAVGFTLWEDIKEFLLPIKGLDDKLSELRKPCMVDGKGRPKKLIGYSFSAMKYGDKQKIPGNSLAMKIKGQFWRANAKLRNKYMILDTVNWDNIPEAFDTDVDDLISNNKSDLFMF